MKSIKSIIAKCNELISQARSEEAIEILSNSDEITLNIRPELVALSSRISALKKDDISGVHSKIDASIESNKINKGILNILSDLEKSIQFYETLIITSSSDFEDANHISSNLKEFGIEAVVILDKRVSVNLIEEAKNLIFIVGSSKLQVANSFDNEKLKINLILPTSNQTNIPKVLSSFITVEFQSIDNSKEYFDISKKIQSTTSPLHTYKNSEIPPHLPQGYRANVKQIVKILIGESLYKKRDVAVRELLQNCYDACIRKAISSGNEYDFDISVNYDSNLNTVIFSDNGEGMNSLNLKKSFSVIGKSLNSDYNQQYHDNDLRKQLIGQFGIGFISTFMIADEISVFTKKEDEDQISFTIKNVTDDFEYLFELSEDEIINASGTIIKIKLNKEGKKIDFIKSLKHYCRHTYEVDFYIDGSKKNFLASEWNILYPLMSTSFTNSTLYEFKLALSKYSDSIIVSNNGFYVSNDSFSNLIEYIPRIFGGEINFQPAAIEINVARDNIILNSKTDIVIKAIETDIKNFILQIAYSDNGKHKRKIFKHILYLIIQKNKDEKKVSYFSSINEMINLVLEIWTVKYNDQNISLKSVLDIMKINKVNKIYFKDHVNNISSEDKTYSPKPIILHKLKSGSKLAVVPTDKYYSIDFHGDVYNSIHSKTVLELICKKRNIALIDFEKPDKEDVESIELEKENAPQSLLIAINSLEKKYGIVIKLLKLGNLNPPIVINAQFQLVYYNDFIESKTYFLNLDNKLSAQLLDPTFSNEDCLYLLATILQTASEGFVKRKIDLPEIMSKNFFQRLLGIFKKK